jgi:hypothetical protein
VAGSGSGFLFLALLFLSFSARKKPATMREPVLLFRVHRGNSVPAMMPESVRLKLKNSSDYDMILTNEGGQSK